MKFISFMKTTFNKTPFFLVYFFISCLLYFKSIEMLSRKVNLKNKNSSFNPSKISKPQSKNLKIIEAKLTRNINKISKS